MQPSKRENCYKCGNKVGDMAAGSGGTGYTNYLAIGPIKGDCKVCHTILKKCDCGQKNPVGRKNCVRCGEKLVDWGLGPAGKNYGGKIPWQGGD
jgi:hypothetical protein